MLNLLVGLFLLAPGLPESLALDPQGKPLTKAQWAALEQGEVLTHLADVAGAAVKQATAVALVDATPAAIFEALNDFAGFPRFMAYVKETEVLEALPEQAEEVTRVRFYLDLPWPVGNRRYVLHMTEAREEREGTEVLVSRWTYEADSGNINDTQGCWEVTACGEGRSFVRYVVLTDPGGKVPVWMRNQATAIAVPAVFKGLREEMTRRASEAPRDAEKGTD